MNWAELLSVIGIALGLAADCFAVALGSSMRGCLKASQILRASLSFGIFQAVMCLAGWLAGNTVLDLISGFDHWVAFALLVIVGGRMIWGSLHDVNESGRDISRGWQLIILSVATSIDSLAVGLSLGVLRLNIGIAASIIGLTSFVISLVGFYIGRRIGDVIGKRAEAVGGILLILIGLKILLS